MKGNGLTRAKKARMVKNNQVINSLLTGEKPNMPDWTKPDYKPPYKEGTGLKTITPMKNNTKSESSFTANTQISTGTGATMPVSTKKKRRVR